MRIGTGYDLHRFVPGRRLILGGAAIPHDRGLAGHSDGDCLSHALADAILGAAGLPDIGHYFPDTDEQHRNMDSLEILRRAKAEAERLGRAIVNLDAVIITEAPKMTPHLKGIKKSLSQALNLPPDAIGLKAKTNERLGATGRGEALAVHTVCLLSSPAAGCRGI